MQWIFTKDKQLQSVEVSKSWLNWKITIMSWVICPAVGLFLRWELVLHKWVRIQGTCIHVYTLSWSLCPQEMRGCVSMAARVMDGGKSEGGSEELSDEQRPLTCHSSQTKPISCLHVQNKNTEVWNFSETVENLINNTHQLRTGCSCINQYSECPGGLTPEQISVTTWRPEIKMTHWCFWAAATPHIHHHPCWTWGRWHVPGFLS